MQAAHVQVISRHAIGHDHAGIIVEVRVRQTQRSKNVRIGESAEPRTLGINLYGR
jgi:hypothetical protein